MGIAAPVGKQQRWYDKRPDLSRSITLLEALPFAIQSIIANGIVDMANREFNAVELINSYKSLGTEKVLALHKSKKKARKLDENPATHKAVTYLYVLSEKNQDFMARQILDLMQIIGQYFRHCSGLNQPPAESEVLDLTQTYVHQGKGEALVFLNKLETIFMERVRSGGKTPVATQQRQEDITEDTSGMRIKD